MLFFGDDARVASARREALGIAAALRAGMDLADVAVDAGALVQGLNDAGAHHAARRWMRWLCASLRQRSRHVAPPSAPTIPVRLKSVEAFAYYGVDPLASPSALDQLRLDQPRIIAILSAGPAMAAAAHAHLDAREDVLLIRPTGVSTSRRTPRLRARDVDGRVVLIIDEGPGLTGSTFLAVARAARRAGARRVVLAPSHDNPPPACASPRIWRRLEKLPAPPDRLAAEIEHAFGAPLRKLVPPIDFGVVAPLAFTSRRDDATWRFDFVGYGRPALDRRRRDAALVEAGLIGEPALCIGPVLARRDTGACAIPTADVVAALLAFRSRRFSALAPPDFDALCQVIDVNTSDIIPDHVRASLIARLRRSRSPTMRVDGGLYAWRWRAPGQLAEGVDASARHDLITDAPLAYDVAGAHVELGLAVNDVCAALWRCGAEIDPADVPPFIVAYLGLERARTHYAQATTSTPRALSARRTAIEAMLVGAGAQALA